MDDFTDILIFAVPGGVLLGLGLMVFFMLR
jgi:hypothetical protein